MGSGLFDRHPDLQLLPQVTLAKVYLPLSGELIIGLRMSHEGIRAAILSSTTFSHNFHVTTLWKFPQSALQVALQELGIERIMFSTDFPFEEMQWASDWI